MHFVWDQSGIRIIGIKRVSVCLGAILIPLFSLETKMASCSGESVEAVERRKGFRWSKQDALLLISQYREHEKLFRNVNCKKKSVWELITASNWRQKIQPSAYDLSRLRESGNRRHSLFASVAPQQYILRPDNPK